jgi:tyrosine-specific transport protein
MKINHFIGGVLLVSGTTIGAGMLALPVMTSFMGFFPSLLVFFICWGFMLATAYFFLDVNFAVEGEINLISMAHKTLGIWGQVVSWVVYLLLLYSLTAAYIAGSGPLFLSGIEYLIGHHLPEWIAPFLLPLIFGIFVYLGTLGVDLINRLLMIGLALSYLFLLGFLPGHINFSLLTFVDFKPSLIAVPVIITSFGYHIIIPSLTTYMQHNRKKLRWILFIGSLIPLIIYILWQAIILGVVPLEGEYGLITALKEGLPITRPLAHIVKNPWLRLGAHFFSFFAIVSSFLGVTLSLSDFLTDGLKIKKSWEGRLLACLLTFIPPLVFVFTYQRGFYLALEYAGAFVAILLIFMPSIMAWHLKEPTFYRTLGGKAILLSAMFFAFLIIVIVFLKEWGFLDPLVARFLS